jgi:hypothetical protein
MAVKHGLAPPPDDAPLHAWPAGTVVFAIERRQRTVLLVERAPLTALDALRAAVWARPVLY